MKTCKICGLEKSLTKFRSYRTKTKGFVHRDECQECKYKYEKRRKASNPDSVKSWWLHKKFNMTLVQYKELEKSQGGVCAICSKSQNNKCLAVDHDHQTGKIRALLCDKCNRGIGLLGDSSTIISRALEYVKKHSNGSEDLKK
jgi:Recombination endonuclease VII